MEHIRMYHYESINEAASHPQFEVPARVRVERAAGTTANLVREERESGSRLSLSSCGHHERVAV